MHKQTEYVGGTNKIRRSLDISLIVVGFVLVVANAAYLILEVKPENVRSIIQLIPTLVGMVIGWSGMALMEMKDEEKTATEVVASVAVQMLLLGLFILMCVVMQK